MLICIVILEMARPECPPDLVARWRLQRERDETLDPQPGMLRVWRGRPEGKDWDSLAAVKQRDGWHLISHRREFVVDNQDGERKDEVEFAGAA